jgi:ketosteroid isomerase-like protein
MSQEMLEDAMGAVLRGISNRDVDLLRAASDPEIEFKSRFTAIEGKTYRGHAGWSEYLADLAVAWAEFSVEIEEFGASGPNALVTVGRVKALARGSGVPIDQRIYAGWQFRDGKALRGGTYPSREEALEAAGLQEQAMSQENVELVRRLYSLRPDAAGVVGGDFDDVFFDYFHPDVELVPPSSYPDSESSYRGQEGVRRWYRQMDEILDDWRFEAESFFDAGNQVVVFVRVSGSAKQSGAAVAISAAHVLTLRDGSVTRADIFLDRSDALEAVGLRE